MASEAPWEVLHPASIAVNLLPRTWRVVRSMWPLALALLWRGQDSDGSLVYFGMFDAGIVGLFFVMTVGGTLWHWLTLRYRVQSGRLEIRTGLLNRQVRTIDPGRIQNVELVASPFHRATGLVEVRIETASGSEVEGLLSALNLDDARDLRSELVRLRDLHRPALDDDQPERVLLESNLSELLTFGATAGRLGAAAVMLGLAFEAITWLAPERLTSLTYQFLGLQGVAVGVVLLSGAWLAGMLGTLARHWGFQLIQRDRGLAVEAGLFTTRRLELPLVKIQLVMTSESLPRRWLGFGTLTLETAAARAGAGGTERRAALAPYVPRDRLPELARIAIPDLDIDPWSATLRPPHPRALPRAIGRTSVRILLVIAIATWLWGPWLLLLGLALPLGALVEWLDHRHQGWRISDRAVVVRRGYLNRRLVVLSRSRIQSVAAHQGPILQRLGLAYVAVRAAGSQVTLPLVSWDEAHDIVDQLVQRLPDPPRPDEPAPTPREPQAT